MPNSFSNVNSVNGDIVNANTNNIDNIGLTAPSLPHSNRISYNPKPWLVYNRFNAATDKHYFHVSFNPATNIWAGKGKTGSIIDMDVSNQDQRMKMDW